jgi:hypothetical protein
MRSFVLWTLAALAGILVAAGITLAASSLSSQRIGLSAEPLTAGERLVPEKTATPQSTPTPPHKERKKRRRSPTPTPTAAATAAPTQQAEPGDDHGGRSRGGSGGGGSSGGRGGGGHGSDD